MGFATELRGRRIISAAATVAAAAAAVSLAVPAMAASRQTASSGILSAGKAGTSAQVPWSKVGPGWALATYSASQGGVGIRPKAGPSTLYLVDPRGGRYKLFTWSARSPQAQWNLIAWSGDVSRALFSSPYPDGSTVPEHLYQLQLRTGRVTGFKLPVNVTAIGYTRPDGLNILAEKGTSTTNPGSRFTLQRYSLTGKLQKNVATIRGLSAVAYQPNGLAIAAGVPRGLELIRNAGGVIRNLPVPGEMEGCIAVRWWNARTILASCGVTNEPGPRMWLVPASGAKPTALTPVRTGSNDFDLGDFNAWKLSSGLYVNGYGGCGSLVIGRQPARGTEQVVNVPHSASSLIVNATSSTLMVERINGCQPGVSLVWFNPATRAMTIAIPDGHYQRGVTRVVPYFIAGKF
jgi:TolB protein